MGGVAAALGVLDGVLHEIVLFAGVGFLIGGADDLATDLVHFGRRLRRRTGIGNTDPALPYTPGRLAVFVPAWDESAVIGLMLRSALARFEHPDYRIYAGAYPNDPTPPLPFRPSQHRTRASGSCCAHGLGPPPRPIA
jgi:adsorption protein B